MAEAGGAAAEDAAAIAARVGASTGMGRLPTPGKLVPCGFAAAGAPAPAASWAGMPLVIPGDVAEAAGLGVAVPGVGRVPDVALVAFVVPGAA